MKKKIFKFTNSIYKVNIHSQSEWIFVNNIND